MSSTIDTFGIIESSGKEIVILIDFSALFLRMSYAMLEELQKSAFEDWGMVKHALMGNILDFKKRFPRAKVVIATDTKESGKYWRHVIFPNYKGNRTQESTIPREILRARSTELRDELTSATPWKIVEVPQAEADDIIGVLAKTSLLKDAIKIVFSSDKDFIQLIDENVYVYDPLKRIIVDEADPKLFLFRQIIKGDLGDAVPNIYSPIDILVNKTGRQPPVRETKVNEMYYLMKEKGMLEFKNAYLTERNTTERFVENRRLVDLACIPQEMVSKIEMAYQNANASGNYNGFLEFCRKNNLSELLGRAQEL